MNSNVPFHIALAGTFVLATGECFLHTLTVNTTANGIITIYDNTEASGTVVAIIKASVSEQTFVYDCHCTNGLTVKTAAASDVTVSFT